MPTKLSKELQRVGEELQVVGHRVLIKPHFLEPETDWGFKIDVTEEFKRQKAATETGIIIGIGPNAWLAFDDGKPWAEVGDEIFFARHAGKFIEWKGEEYLIINDEDCQCIVHRDVEGDSDE